jgi:hypothetical protein
MLGQERHQPERGVLGEPPRRTIGTIVHQLVSRGNGLFQPTPKGSSLTRLAGVHDILPVLAGGHMARCGCREQRRHRVLSMLHLVPDGRLFVLDAGPVGTLARPVRRHKERLPSTRRPPVPKENT